MSGPEGHRGRIVSYVAQNAAAAFNPALTIGRQVAEPLVVHSHQTEHVARVAAIQLLEHLGLPASGDLGHRYPHQLSGGQLQRALAAMGLIITPELIVLDEPTTALEVTTQVRFLIWIKGILSSTKLSAIYVSHDLAIVAQVADRCVVMRDGAIVEEGTTAHILTDARAPYTKQLISARDRAGLALEQSSFPQAGAQRSPKDEELAAVRVSVDHRIQRLSLGRRRKRVVTGVSLRVSRGEIVGLIGEFGSGKSSLARALSGLHRISEGTLTLDGQKLSPSVAGRTKNELKRIQIVFQSPDTSLNSGATVASTLARALNQFFRFGADDRTRKIRSLLSMVGLPPEFAARGVLQLSGGQKQRLCIARALAAEPEYLICDEVLSSLDTIVAQEILMLITRLQSKHRFGCLFISHDLDVVRGFADRVVVLQHGRIVEEGETEQVLSRPVD